MIELDALTNAFNPATPLGGAVTALIRTVRSLEARLTAAETELKTLRAAQTPVADNSLTTESK